jgi:hypothetical protein
MRRYLVLTTEAAGHPFRRMLPPAVLAIAPGVRPPREPLSDTRLFATTFCAAFLAIYGFFA